MKVISATASFKLKKTCVAIGIFDGLHRGHQYLLKGMQRKARQLKAKSVALTFFPHPAHVLRPDIKLGYLVSLLHRLKLLESIGIDICIILPFTKAMAAVEPQAFVRDILVKRLDARAVFVGEDFRFGRSRSGDVKLLAAMAPSCGYEMHAVPALMQDKGPVSSTRVRGLVTAGDLAGAKKLLGRPFSILGEVVEGKGRGKQLGFPTANVHYANDILPPVGVYAVRVTWKDKTLAAVANLGLRPSFKEKNPHMLLEVHIFDFNHRIYGQTIEVAFIKKLRAERNFPSPQALVEQIRKDAAQARRILK